MTFSSVTFLFLFFPVTFLLYAVIRNHTARNFILAAASLVFYAFGEPIYIFLMIISIIINYFIALLIDKKKKRLLLILAIIFNIGLLIVFKYTDFIIDINNYLLHTNFFPRILLYHL